MLLAKNSPARSFGQRRWYYFGFGGGLGLGTPVVSYAPRPMSLVEYVFDGLVIMRTLRSPVCQRCEIKERDVRQEGSLYS